MGAELNRAGQDGLGGKLDLATHGGGRGRRAGTQSRRATWGESDSRQPSGSGSTGDSLPAIVCENVLNALVPRRAARWGERTRPIPSAVAFVQQRFRQGVVLEGSTLDSLLGKTGLVRELATNPLAGRIAAVLDVVTRLSVQWGYKSDDKAHDQRFWLSVIEHRVSGS